MDGHVFSTGSTWSCKYDFTLQRLSFLLLRLAMERGSFDYAGVPV